MGTVLVVLWLLLFCWGLQLFHQNKMFSAFRRGEKYKDHFETGIYVCAKCGYELFSSATKYKHESPWPAFNQTFHKDSVTKVEEKPGAYKVSCSKCGNGLGHVMDLAANQDFESSVTLSSSKRPQRYLMNRPIRIPRTIMS